MCWQNWNLMEHFTTKNQFVIWKTGFKICIRNTRAVRRLLPRLLRFVTHRSNLRRETSRPNNRHYVFFAQLPESVLWQSSRRSWIVLKEDKVTVKVLSGQPNPAIVLYHRVVVVVWELYWFLRPGHRSISAIVVVFVACTFHSTGQEALATSTTRRMFTWSSGWYWPKVHSSLLDRVWFGYPFWRHWN